MSIVWVDPARSPVSASAGSVPGSALFFPWGKESPSFPLKNISSHHRRVNFITIIMNEELTRTVTEC
jgi:hypothetical protein